MSDRFRRPTEAWCTQTAIRLLQIGCREPERYPALLEWGDAVKLVEAAALLDAYGQRLARERARS